MSLSFLSATGSEVVSQLRAAGCVFAEEEAEIVRLSARNAAHLDALVRRRAAGVPLEHVVGWAEFHGSRVAVEPGVFEPRLGGSRPAAVCWSRPVNARRRPPPPYSPPPGWRPRWFGPTSWTPPLS